MIDPVDPSTYTGSGSSAGITASGSSAGITVYSHGSIVAAPAPSGSQRTQSFNFKNVNSAAEPDTTGTAARRNTSSGNWWETEVRTPQNCASDAGSPHRKHRQVGCEAFASGFSTGSDQVTPQARRSAHKKTKYE
jgi:hypothetical protein